MTKNLNQDLAERQAWADANMEADDADGFDALEDAMADCGQTSEGYCMLAGTEYCDFECPFSG